ncbi:MAG: hypothetical protein RIB32_01205 [Phycisphaerales bacterium]
MNISLKDLIITGSFNGVRVGDTADSVEAMLGEPTDWSLPSKERAARLGVWKYGPIELHFVESALAMIFCDDIEGIQAKHDRVVVDPWIVTPSLTVETAGAALDAIGVAYERGQRAELPDRSSLRVESGVSLSFSLPETAGTLLNLVVS